MPQVYELLGYPLSDKSDDIEMSRRKAFCPFMNAKCDGGGNRFMSEISLNDHPELKNYFPDMDKVPSGICSIQLSPGTSPWIICPRRLLYMGRKASQRTLAGTTQKALLSKCKFPKDARIGIWAETKVKYIDSHSNEENASFDYTFDYVLCELGRITMEEACVRTKLNKTDLKHRLTSAGYTMALVDGEITIEDFPIGKPYIVEVMTSSTSGGNKKNRSCIPQAFEDCILDKKHIAPGINYRQVWARMVSQMIVKSQAAIAWGGYTIWVLQDLLADYISASTALDLTKFISDELSEVNVLSFSYSDKFKYPNNDEIIELTDSTLFAGPIRPKYDSEIVLPSFQDIVLASVCPPIDILLAALCKKSMSNILKLSEH